MNPIIALLLSALMGRRMAKKQDRKGGGQERSPLLRMRRPIRTVHLLPGRVRFQVPAIRQRPADARLVVDQLGKIQGVRSVDANPVSTSVLITYDPSRIQPELLFAALVKVLGLETEVERTPSPLVAKELCETLESVNHAVFDRTHGLLDLWTALALTALLPGSRAAGWANALVLFRAAQEEQQKEK